MRFRPPAPQKAPASSARRYPSLDLADRLALDAVVAVIGKGLAIVAGRLAAVHLDQLGAVAAAGSGAVRGLGGGTGILPVDHDQVPALEAARIEAGDGIHRRGV